MCTSSLVDQLLTTIGLRYSEEVMVVPLPLKFHASLMDTCDGARDPLEHLETFRAHMTLHGFLGEVACRAFPLTLKEAAQTWFGSLSLGTIDSFEELVCLFMTQFLASRKRRCSTAYLLIVNQRDGESLK